MRVEPHASRVTRRDYDFLKTASVDEAAQQTNKPAKVIQTAQ